MTFGVCYKETQQIVTDHDLCLSHRNKKYEFAFKSTQENKFPEQECVLDVKLLHLCDLKCVQKYVNTRKIPTEYTIK